MIAEPDDLPTGYVLGRRAGVATLSPVESDHDVNDRDEDFVRYVFDEVAIRQAAEDAFFAGVDLTRGEVRATP